MLRSSNFELAWRSRRSRLGEEHPEVEDTSLALALALESESRLEEARPLFEADLRIKIKNGGEASGRAAEAFNNLGEAFVYRSMKHDGLSPTLPCHATVL